MHEARTRQSLVDSAQWAVRMSGGSLWRVALLAERRGSFAMEKKWAQAQNGSKAEVCERRTDCCY